MEESREVERESVNQKKNPLSEKTFCLVFISSYRNPNRVVSIFYGISSPYYVFWVFVLLHKFYV
ncbi:hypothetical protein HM131_10075 [Halobacillus mangrovi]|uniref:Uncharacterized protein n=1 Tax=Halobacillus mangrovi TaxID=402384 RepID=A0A1W5ZV12_9BACI|nr:hypothetical protein HM131_10075 [Halobacillus mangrovi]